MIMLCIFVSMNAKLEKSNQSLLVVLMILYHRWLDKDKTLICGRGGGGGGGTKGYTTVTQIICYFV